MAMTKSANLSAIVAMLTDPPKLVAEAKRLQDLAADANSRVAAAQESERVAQAAMTVLDARELRVRRDEGRAEADAAKVRAQNEAEARRLAAFEAALTARENAVEARVARITAALESI